MQFERLVLLSDLTGILLGVDQVVCLDPSGSQRWRLRHPLWPRGRVGGDVVVIDQRLVIVVPASPVLAGYGIHPVELAVVDTANGSESEREPLIDEIGDLEVFTPLPVGTGTAASSTVATARMARKSGGSDCRGAAPNPLRWGRSTASWPISTLAVTSFLPRHMAAVAWFSMGGMTSPKRDAWSQLKCSSRNQLITT